MEHLLLVELYIIKDLAARNGELDSKEVNFLPKAILEENTLRIVVESQASSDMKMSELTIMIKEKVDALEALALR